MLEYAHVSKSTALHTRNWTLKKALFFMQFLDDEENFGEQMSFFYFAEQYLQNYNKKIDVHRKWINSPC